MFLYRVIDQLNRHQVEYALVGGFAVALHGAVRGTIDIDLIITIDENAFRHTEEALTELGLTPRLPISADELFANREHYIRERNLVAWSFVNADNPLEVVDIIINENLQQMQTVTKSLADTDVRLLAIPDLIRMKQRSGRPQDIEDIRALERLV